MLDKLPAFLTNIVAGVAANWRWFDRKVNRIAINATVNVARNRPHPLSTAHDYVSWVTLSDRRWSGRHLSPTQTPPTADPKAVVELFRRPPTGQKLSKRSTCLFPAFAQYLTDGFIRTRMNDSSAGEPDSLRLQNTSNHEIDMCPLYGRTIEQTDALRLKSQQPGKKGRLKSQMVGKEEYAPYLLDNGVIKKEFEKLDPPLGLSTLLQDRPQIAKFIFAFGGDRTNASPQVAMINTLFLREHNRLAGTIEAANPTWDDEHVFQVARNTVIVLFIKIVVEEYINHISASVRFHVDPEVAWDAKWNRPNWITTEFSLLYRWHPLVPDVMRWRGQAIPVFVTLMNNELLLSVGLRRAFEEQSAQAAGELCAMNTADALLEREIRAIEQGRLCKLPTYAAYRKYVTLPEPKRFEDISSNKEVVALLKKAYARVEDVEFYPGLFAEDNDSDSPLPPMMRKLVALDAFSQALTNPLLSEHVYEMATFSRPGWDAINDTRELRDIVVRNSAGGSQTRPIGMTFTPQHQPTVLAPLQDEPEPQQVF
ncbi:peroxidase family protein [Ramlibacter sp. WS9]|uniref:peroxidase family protein n=1 Tax=Ramlibacter sp. WS9 TaxID=1882741 RepID=UPI00114433B8|nr:peroxidase family protein [Ramlibacter sp. WS9]ROZ69371.1 heme peroxidase [Ramlibacter sp. WS9]